MQKLLLTRKSTRKALFKKKALILLLFGIFCLHVLSGYAQEAGNTVRGVVVDETGESLPGASITVKGSTRGVATDTDGSFSISVKPEDVLIVSFLGYQNLEVNVGAQKQITVQLKPKANELDEVTIVAFGKQKKESIVSAVQTVNVKDLVVPSSNLTTAFAGRIAGMISYQTSGEPGFDNADFFIRGVTSFGTGKVDPLILIDNVEVTSSDMAKLHPDDLQSFSILKDATATALYGARGANGVILITTKEGKEGKVKVSVRLENSLSSPTSKLEMADPITYMRLANEATLTRNPFMSSGPYSESKIDNTIRGTNPNMYPTVDWMNLLIKDVTQNQRANLNISGGGKVARYYVAGSFSQDNGILKVDKRNNFNNNVNYKKYMLRSNINLDITKTTEMIVRMSGAFDDYQGPIAGGSDLYKQILNVSPVRFPAYYEPDSHFQSAGHILFGTDRDNIKYLNPYAEMVKGYNTNSNSTLSVQLELKQDFSQLTEGLTARVMFNTTRYGSFSNVMAYEPFKYAVAAYNKYDNTYTLQELNPEKGREYLEYTEGSRSVNSTMYGEASAAYNRTFNNKHDVSGMLVGILRNYLTGNPYADSENTLLTKSLPYRNLGLSGRFTYGYDSRYFGEFNFGYNGSEKFDKGHRWGFFPSFGVGWKVSNEAFWDGMKKVISLLKIRGTYGLVGNDEIGSARFFYLSNVTPGEGNGYQTGFDYTGFNLKGYSIKNYANPNIGWEIARKSNLGIELGLFGDKVEIQADIFKEHRTNILQKRADIPDEMGLWSTPLVNIGEANGKGVDISIDYKHSINRDWWLVGRANFTYARSTYAFYEESDYTALGVPWKLHAGQPVSQQWGYIAERLFIDDYDVAASARQEFGEYGAGDIKYKDLDGNGVINVLDQGPIGYPKTPEINYGFGLSSGYKNFDLSVFFSGSDRSSFWIDANMMSPFVRKTIDGNGAVTTDLSKGSSVLEGGLAQFIAADHWTELNQNPYALWPRFSDRTMSNNTQTSTWFMYDNTFLRLKSAEFGYSMPQYLVKKLRLESFRIYASGTNLLMFSKFNIWDVEMGGNGLNYPLQRVINLGINLSF